MKIHVNRTINKMGASYHTRWKGEKIFLNEPLMLQASRRGQISIKTKEIKNGQTYFKRAT